MLQSEMNRVEDLLANSRAERDEIGIKYNALSERVGGQFTVNLTKKCDWSHYDKDQHITHTDKYTILYIK